MKITENSAVLIHYHLTDDDGEVIDSSKGRDALGYLHGHGQLVDGVERALEGKEAGDHIDVVVSPEDGYGVRDPEMDVAIPLSSFPDEAQGKIEPGMMFEGSHPEDPEASVPYTVIEVLDDRVHATGNHDLADVTLHFSLDVVSVREATEEELSHGHLHGEGGHHH